jgi:hypothetical protein
MISDAPRNVVRLGHFKFQNLFVVRDRVSRPQKQHVDMRDTSAANPRWVAILRIASYCSRIFYGTVSPDLVAEFT